MHTIITGKNSEKRNAGDNMNDKNVEKSELEMEELE